MRQLGPLTPRFQCCGLSIKWGVFPRSKKMTLYVNRLRAHHGNIEIEGTGVGMRWQSHKLPCVIFFDNTGVRFPLFSDKNNYANLAYGSRHTLVRRQHFNHNVDAQATSRLTEMNVFFRTSEPCPRVLSTLNFGVRGRRLLITNVTDERFFFRSHRTCETS